MFTFKSALLFWLLASSVPLLTSLAYFRASPVTDSLAQRISVSLHGVTVSALCIAAVLVGMVGTPRPSLAEPFHLLLLVPVVLALYSFWRFRGNKAIHLLQSINLLWLALASYRLTRQASAEPELHRTSLLHRRASIYTVNGVG